MPAPRTAHDRRSPLAWVLGVLIRLYQRTSILRQPRCRFHPTCSHYALESIQVHGALRGTWYAIARVGKCHPWHPGGFDPVKSPPIRKKQP